MPVIELTPGQIYEIKIYAKFGEIRKREILRINIDYDRVEFHTCEDVNYDLEFKYRRGNNETVHGKI